MSGASVARGGEGTAASATSPSGVRAPLRVLTLNVWGLPEPLSKCKRQRLAAVAERLRESTYDVVALQELWVSRVDFVGLQACLASRYPHSKFFYGGAWGMGLALFSRYPIVRTRSVSYDYNGLPTAVAKGDWIVGKGAGCATLAVPGLSGGLDVWITHTVAAGGEDGPEWTRSPRITQAWQLAQWARDSAQQGRHVLVMGDLNCTPPSLSARLLRHVGGLTDVFLATHPDVGEMAVTLPPSPGGEGAATPAPDPTRALAELGVTCDSPLNTWTAGKKLDARALGGAGKRLDYIFFTPPRTAGDVWAPAPTSASASASASALASAPSARSLVPLECSVTFTDLIPGLNISYTDHFGVEASFALPTPDDAHARDAVSPQAATATTQAAVECLDLSLAALARGLQQAELNQRRWLAAFLAFLIIALAVVLSAWRAHGAAAVCLTILAGLAGFAGTTALYTGLIWGEWEKRIYHTMLESMREELRCIRQRARTSDDGGTGVLVPYRDADAEGGTGADDLSLNTVAHERGR